MLTVLSAAFYPSTEHISKFLASADMYGIDVNLYGIGEKWVSFCDNKINLLSAELEKVTTPYVLYVDSYDTRFQGSVDEILSAYLPMSSDVVISGDRRCWPLTKRRRWFLNRTPYGSKFPYLCAGVFIGKTDKVLRTINIMRELWLRETHVSSNVNINDDQFWWMYCLTSGLIKAKPDVDGSLVVSTCAMKDEEYSIDDGIFTMDGYVPPIVHMNGRTSKRLLEKL